MGNSELKLGGNAGLELALVLFKQIKRNLALALVLSLQLELSLLLALALFE